MAELVQYYGTGRRKTAIARVFLRPGTGEMKVNGKPFDVYLVTDSQRIAARSPLTLTETAGSFNLIARVTGFSLWRFLRHIKEEILLVLGTSSSEAALQTSSSSSCAAKYSRARMSARPRSSEGSAGGTERR